MKKNDVTINVSNTMFIFTNDKNFSCSSEVNLDEKMNISGTTRIISVPKYILPEMLTLNNFMKCVEHQSNQMFQ